MSSLVSRRLVSSLSSVLALCPVSGLLYFLKVVIYPRISLQSLITDPLAIERT